MINSPLSNPPSPKKPFPYLKTVIYSFLFVILMLPMVVVFALLPSDGIFRSLKGGVWSEYFTVSILNPSASCRVRNVNSGFDYMIPYRSDFEWDKFKSAPYRLLI